MDIHQSYESNAAVAALLSLEFPNVNKRQSNNFNFNNEHPYEPYLDPLDVEPPYLAHQGGNVDSNNFPNTSASCSSLRWKASEISKF